MSPTTAGQRAARPHHRFATGLPSVSWPAVFSIEFLERHFPPELPDPDHTTE
ncbi:hypothetical protein [Streptomyces sp. NPDC056291]|uniref:hypothetical protein n=1 Tax=Streptomyces sp. NPDC056291 TaxID=3345772 RepID=UPI0035DC2ADA